MSPACAATSFRRERSIDWHIIDFACFAARLVIEMDGRNVLNNMEGVMAVIAEMGTEEPPLLGPPPQGGRG